MKSELAPSATSAQTLPPKPAPNADAAAAPSRRASRARPAVSGTWLPSHCFDGLLRSIDEYAEARQVAAAQRIARAGHDGPALQHELIEALPQQVDAEFRVARRGDRLADAVGGAKVAGHGGFQGADV